MIGLEESEVFVGLCEDIVKECNRRKLLSQQARLEILLFLSSPEGNGYDCLSGIS